MSGLKTDNFPALWDKLANDALPTILDTVEIERRELERGIIGKRVWPSKNVD